MTWVVGLTTVGIGALVADTRVSFQRRNGQLIEIEDFGVLKIHPITPYLLVGFSGSIEVGFWCVNDMRQFLRPTFRSAPEPDVFVRRWTAHARRSFPIEVAKRLLEMPTELLVVGLSQEQRLAQWPVSQSFHLSLPWAQNANLEARVIDQSSTLPIPDLRPTPWVKSIGSGSGLDAYAPRLLDLDRDLLLRLTDLPAAAGALVLSMAVTHLMDGPRVVGVSRNLVAGIVNSSGCDLNTNLLEPVEAMPPLARNPAEWNTFWQRFCRRNRLGTAVALSLN